MTLLVFPHRQTPRTHPGGGSIARDHNGSRRLSARHFALVLATPPRSLRGPSPFRRRCVTEYRSPPVWNGDCARALARARSCSSALYVGCSAAMVGVSPWASPALPVPRHNRSHHRVLGIAKTLHGEKAGPFFSSCSRQVYAAVALDNPTSTSPPSTFVNNIRHRHDRHHGPRHGAPRQHQVSVPLSGPDN